MQALGLLAAILVTASSAASGAELLTPERQIAMARVGAPVPDPAGRRVVYTVSEYDSVERRRQTHLWLLDLETGEGRRLTQEASASAPAWSADGRELLFLRDGQIWALPLDGGEAREVTTIPTKVSGFALNPDPQAPASRRFTIHSRVHPDCPEAEWACSERARDRWDNRPGLITEQLPLRHWSSWRDSLRAHVFLGDAHSDTWIDLTPGWAACPPFALSAGADYLFSPDGQQMAIVRNLDPETALSTDNDIFLIDLAEAVRRGRAEQDPWAVAERISRGLSGGGGVDDQPAFSPDGRYLAYTSMERGGCESDLRRIVLRDLRSGREHCLTCGLDRSAFGLVWSADARHLYFDAYDRETSTLYRVEVATGQTTALLRSGALGGLAPLPDGRLLSLLGSSRLPTEIFICDPDRLAEDPRGWRGDLALTSDGRYGTPLEGRVHARPPVAEALGQLTFHNWAALRSLEMSRPEHFWFAGARGDSVHGFILRPPPGATHLGADSDPARVPLVMVLHGGPQWAYHDFWLRSYNFQMIAAQGFAVATVNFHGSAGYGFAFQDAIRGHWGGLPGEDVARGLDHILANYDFVDPERIAAIGRSYGGYLVNWLNGHSTRFDCLVAHSGSFDEAAGWGTTEELWFPEWEFLGPPWEQWDTYRANSPATYAAQMRTPTLVIHGQRDYRVDLSDGLQTYATLKRQGVAARFLTYPEEGHHIHQPDSWLLMWREIFGWLHRYLG
jgi:dipeptidyl aminopeptidase/acylaminoacyl peptidase